MPTITKNSALGIPRIEFLGLLAGRNTSISRGARQLDMLVEVSFFSLLKAVQDFPHVIP